MSWYFAILVYHTGDHKHMCENLKNYQFESIFLILAIFHFGTETVSFWICANGVGGEVEDMSCCVLHHRRFVYFRFKQIKKLLKLSLFIVLFQKRIKNPILHDSRNFKYKFTNHGASAKQPTILSWTLNCQTICISRLPPYSLFNHF